MHRPSRHQSPCAPRRAAARPVRQAAMRGAMAACALACALAAPPPAAAQHYEIDLSRIDPAAVIALGDDVLLRAPDAAIDRLFSAVHASAGSERESAALCALFEPDAPRDIAAFQRAVDGLGDASRERFARAFTGIALSGLEGTPQAYDPQHARQVLKSAAVSATLLHEGFMQGLAAGDDPAGREARCRSFRWLVGVLHGLPASDRVAATRWLLREGLSLAAASR